MLIKPKKKDNKSNMTAQEQLEAIFYKVNELEPMKDIAYKNIMLELMEYGVEQINFRSASIEAVSYTHLVPRPMTKLSRKLKKISATL